MSGGSRPNQYCKCAMRDINATNFDKRGVNAAWLVGIEFKGGIGNWHIP